MNRILSFTLILLGTLYAGGFAIAADDTDTEMIVGGRPAPEGKFPYQVRLYSRWTTRRASAGARSSPRNGF